MSEPVTNVEIEDVLSSIRRLVSDERRKATETPPPQSEATEKLVLTPALRVDGVQDGYATMSGIDAPDVPLADDVADDVDGATRPLMADATDSAERPELPERADGLTARVAEFEQLVAGRADQWEPDGQSLDAYSGGAVGSLPWEDDEAEAGPEEADGPDTGRAFDLDAATVEVEDLPDDHQPEEGAAASEPPQDVAEPGLAVKGGRSVEDAILDETALRELVTAIVREELQGVLGERITRNVRKLVRREIHRALASEQME